MLTLTENAANVIERLVANADRGVGSGIRILSGRDHQPSGMEVRFANEHDQETRSSNRQVSVFSSTQMPPVP